MKPDRMEFKLGQTIHGAPLRLVYAKEAPPRGGYAWSLIKDQGNQRDDIQMVTGISDEAMTNIVEIVRSMSVVGALE